MSRLKNFSRNLATSYLQMGVNVAYSLAAIPIILHWLPKAEFGLWMLLLQLMGYISLVDLGINQAIARFLVDHKDHRHTGTYGALVKTSLLVSVVQGLIVLTVVAAGAPLLAALMKIPSEYQALFIALIRMQGIIAAFNFCMNPFGIMINAHQRVDILMWQGMLSLIASLGFLVLFLMKGSGLYAFVYVNAITAALAPIYLFWQCRRLNFLPLAGEWGKVSWKMFNEVFLYGKDVFLMSLGAQLITASQTIIISRMLGLEAAAAWSVGTKIFMLVRQIMFQPYSAAIAGLSEMMARNETGRLLHRFKHLVVLTASLGVYLGVAYVMCNSLFVQIWTSGKIMWPLWNDILLGLWIFFTALQVPHCNFVAVTKQIGAMRYLYFAEGCTFVTLSLLVAKRWGMPGILLCSALCVMLFSYQFGLRRSRQFFHVGLSELALDWVRPSLKLAGALSVAAVMIWLATSSLPVIWRLAIHAVVIGIGGGLLFLRLGLPAEVVQETRTRLPRHAARLLEILAPCKI